MNKTFVTVCAALLSSFCVSAQDLIQHVTARHILSLNGRWNYIIDPYDNGYYNYRHDPFDETPSGKGGYYDNNLSTNKGDLIEYNFSLSPMLKVPADWNSQDNKLLLYEGTIWYKRDFNVKVKDGMRYFLHFGGVNYEAHVYVNGKKLGVHRGGFTPFQYEITNTVKNGNNFVVVKVNNNRKQDEIPTVNTDWWNYGGITRDVTVIETTANFIKDYKVQLKKNDLNVIEGFVQLSENAKGELLTLQIPQLKLHKSLATDQAGKVTFSFFAKDIKHWTPQQPFLYEVKIASKRDTIQDKIGFRTIEVRDKDILLNGKSVFLRGISLHDENPLIPGRLRGEDDVRMMLTWAKELGCNYVRLAHYTHNEKMLRVADELGLMVWAEVPVYWTISWDNEGTYKNAKNQISEMIARDKNRASVIIWSIGNETPVNESRNKFMSGLSDYVRALDDTRLVAAALEVKREGNKLMVDDPLGAHLDLASFNEYGGWYWGSIKELSSLTFEIMYNKPVVISEFGGDALAGFHADDETRWSEEYQETLYVNQLKMLENIEGLRGMTPWILTDFRSPRRQHPLYQEFWNRKGLISDTGTRKKAFYVLQKYYLSKQNTWGAKTNKLN